MHVYLTVKYICQSALKTHAGNYYKQKRYLKHAVNKEGLKYVDVIKSVKYKYTNIWGLLRLYINLILSKLSGRWFNTTHLPNGAKCLVLTGDSALGNSWIWQYYQLNISVDHCEISVPFKIWSNTN